MPDTATTSGAWKSVIGEARAKNRTSSGNKLTLLTGGDRTFRSLWADIDAAQKRVWLEVYIFRNDDIGRRTLEALVDAARRGCDVILLYDSLGSVDTSPSFFAPLEKAGGHVVAYNLLSPFQQLRRRAKDPLHRDHRKILIVDDHVGYSGGTNVSERDAGPELGTNYFYDTLLRVEGPAARSLARLFLKTLEAASALKRAVPTEGPVTSEGALVRVMALDGRSRRDILDAVLARAIEQARMRCFITAAYLVAPQWLKRALIEASRRGVDVRILTAGQTDVAVSKRAKRHVYGDLLQGGVRIYEMTEQTLHAKNLVIDGCFSIVGSYNMDRWADLHNLEVCMATLDDDVAQILGREFERNVQRSVEWSLADWNAQPFYRKVLQRACYSLMKL